MIIFSEQFLCEESKDSCWVSVPFGVVDAQSTSDLQQRWWRKWFQRHSIPSGCCHATGGCLSACSGTIHQQYSMLYRYPMYYYEFISNYVCEKINEMWKRQKKSKYVKELSVKKKFWTIWYITCHKSNLKF